MKTHVAYEKKYRRVKAKLLDSQYTLGAYLSTIEAERDAIRTRNGVTHQRLHRWVKMLLRGLRRGYIGQGGVRCVRGAVGAHCGSAVRPAG